MAEPYKEPKRFTTPGEFVRVVRYEWRTRHAWHGPLAASRGLWWVFVRRYACEMCNCGRRIGMEIGNTTWHADDELWNRVMGEPGWEERLGEYARYGVPGTRCTRCFTEIAEAKGIRLHWQPVRRD